MKTIVLNEDFPGLTLSNDSYILRGDLVVDGNLDLVLDKKLIVVGAIEVNGWLKSFMGLRADTHIKVGKWLESVSFIDAGTWIDVEESIHTGEWIYAGTSIKSRHWIESGAWIKAGLGVHSDTYIKSKHGVDVLIKLRNGV